MRVLVTGSNGFVGKYVVQKLISEGYHVIGIGRTHNDFEHEKFSFYQADITDKEQLCTFFKLNSDISGIVHLAADININGSDNTIITNCLGTYYLSYYSVINKLKFFVNISSIPVIGKPIIIPVTEEHPTHPDSLYHISKLTGEQIVENTCAGFMKIFNLRISSPIGIGMPDKNYLSVLIDKCIKNEAIEVYGTGARVQNYIDVRDVADAIVCAMRSDKSGLYLIAADESISNIELAKLCINLLNSHSEIVLNRIADAEEGNKWHISAQKACQEIGFLPKHTLSETIKWIYENK